MLFDKIPKELKLDGLWCCWRLDKSKEGRMTKIPYDAITGRMAQSNNKATFHLYSEVIALLYNYYSLPFVYPFKDFFKND